eukprot:TRINITY_DN33624_c0_g1_i1.p1 TRINITY_DN33624_c0_g1~~TRINITY_DN33624_c0_g1_i1.p1  ORF type:complete len:197 (+),score=-21.06 TRINITY_DN33624_c0_g1_i1:84-593(+)
MYFKFLLIFFQRSRITLCTQTYQQVPSKVLQKQHQQIILNHSLIMYECQPYFPNDFRTHTRKNINVQYTAFFTINYQYIKNASIDKHQIKKKYLYYTNYVYFKQCELTTGTVEGRIEQHAGVFEQNKQLSEKPRDNLKITTCSFYSNISKLHSNVFSYHPTEIRKIFFM